MVDSAMNARAVILLSGGLDSATVLAMARAAGLDCHALSVSYGQRHQAELNAAARVAHAQGAREHRIMHVDLGRIGGSALTDKSIDVPTAASEGIPITYVPARNTIFLSLALAYAETLDARMIYFGANVVDYSGYPDCRPEFIRAFETVARVGTKMGAEGRKIEVRAPLLLQSKAEIVRCGQELQVPFALTHSCYDPGDHGMACGRCDSCRIRREGFRQAGVVDPIPYAIP